MKNEFTRLFFFAFKLALKNIQNAISNNEYISTHYDFPKVEKFDNGLPYFTKHFLSENAPRKYSSIFGKDSKFNIYSSKEWKNLLSFVKNETYLTKYFSVNEESKLDAGFIETGLYNSVTTFTEYYLHITKNKRAIRQTFLKFFKPFVNSIFFKKLHVSICLPVPLIKFSFNKKEISDDIFFEKIPDEIQLGRNNTFASNNNHNLITGAATHYLVLNNWSIDNPHNLLKIYHTLSNDNSYDKPIEIFKNFIAALRLETNLMTGLTQIVTIPDNWVTDWKGHIKQIYRTKLDVYNYELEDGGWRLDQESINSVIFKRIVHTFNNINSISDNSFRIAIERFNEYYTRKSEKDKIIDLTTALESLITNDTRSEITYRLSNRIAILFKKHKIKLYSSSDVFDIIKKIYKYRSAVVHGEHKLDKKRKIVLPTKESVSAVELAHDILREILIIQIKNKSIYNPDEIDKLLLSC